ncbi:oligosaccharide flippase family protein [Vibrio metschnikovii]|uniref:oligosaccharide flippase family protein n=1 Tax=Vibrio metschnikovii TaxID=28172 RepID=UPI00315CBC13|nr:oligosaccharide flippase family protein [Vibrio metschnikovii]
MIKEFFKDSLLYTLSNLFTRGIGFLLLPIYTRLITKYDYGLFDYLTTLGVILGVVVTLEVTQAIYRYMPDFKDDKFRQISVASTGLWFTVLMYLVLCVFSFLFSEFLAGLLLDDVNHSNLIKITSVLFFSNAILYNLTSLMRANLLSKQVVLISALNAILVASFSLIFVTYFKLGVEGLIFGQLIGSSITFLFAFVFVKHWIKFQFSISTLKEMLSFSAPLIFSSLGVVLTMFIDRIMIKNILGAEQLASYAVAIKIASIVSLLMVGFQSALTPLIYTNYKNLETAGKIAKLFHLYLVAALFSFIVLGYSSSWLITIVAGQQYYEGAMYVPILVCSALISSMYLFFPGLSIEKKTTFIAGINVFVGALNVSLNYIFIPIYGVRGAALSTLFSVLLSFLLNLFYSQKYYKISFSLSLIISVFFITIFFLMLLTCL